MTDEERAECIGMDEFPLYCNQITGCQADCILDTMETDDPYPVRFGWIVEHQPARSDELRRAQQVA